jgi:hypothetical protein
MYAEYLPRKQKGTTQPAVPNNNVNRKAQAELQEKLENTEVLIFFIFILYGSSLFVDGSIEVPCSGTPTR